MAMPLKRSLHASVFKFGDDEAARIVRAIVTDATRDRVGEVLVPAGAQWSQYLSGSATVLWQHDSNHPVAKCIDLRMINDQIVGTARFPRPGVSAQADECYDLIKEGVINSVSVGFIPLEYERIERDEDENTPWNAWKYTKFEIIEWSFVSIPCNPSANIIHRSLNHSVDFDDFEEAHDPASIKARHELAAKLASVKAGWSASPAWKIAESERVAERVAKLIAETEKRLEDEARAPQLQLAHLRAVRRAGW